MVRVLTCVAFALCAGSAWAQDAAAPSQNVTVPVRLSLADALRIAVERNPTIAAARNGVEIAEAQRLDARLRPNPALTFDSVGRPPVSTPRGVDDHEYLVRVDQEIETAGRRRLRSEAAQSAIAAAESQRANRLRQVEFEVRRAYFQVVLAQADREVAQTSLNEIDQVIGLNRARFQEGEISGADVRRLQVERLRFADDVFAAELALRNARSALLALFNVPDLSQSFDVVEPLEPTADTVRVGTVALTSNPNAPIDRTTLLQQALDVRPDVAAARQEQQRADSETRLQRALRTPNVTVGGGYSHLGGLNTLAFGVTVPLPLSNRNQGGVARAEAESRRAANELAAATTSVRLDVQQAVNALDINRQRVNYIRREYLANARQSRDIVLASYRLGAADLIDFLDAQRAYRDTQRTYNRALYEERVSIFELQAAVGSADAQLP